MGQIRLNKAAQRYSGPVDIVWKPYMIDPATDIDGEEFEAYNRRRWGGSGWTNHLKQEGRKDGAMFSNWKWWPHTLKAHRLVQYALINNQVDRSRSNAALFEALYEEGENISLADTLVKVGTTKLGIQSENGLRNYLKSQEGTQQVQDEISRGRQSYRISGVPFFVIGTEGQTPYGISGAQKTETFVELFQELSQAL